MAATAKQSGRSVVGGMSGGGRRSSSFSVVLGGRPSVSKAKSVIDNASFVAEIRKKPFLYVIGHPEHKFKRKRQLAWIDIAKKFGITVPQAMSKWKALRKRSSGGEEGTNVMSACAGEDNGEDSWEPMAFESVVKSPECIIQCDNLSEEVERDPLSSDTDAVMSDRLNPSITRYQGNTSGLKFELPMANGHQETLEEQVTNDSKDPKTEALSMLKSICGTVSSLVEREEDNEHYFFGMDVAQRLNRLPRISGIQAKRAISNILCDIELQVERRR